tara:strand:+ start:147 stop:773 length:627 start_codon:yes stop_codon:yes gene_type:complete
MAIQINGNGTITGISVGGLPDGIVDTDMIAANAVATAKIADNAVTSAKSSGLGGLTMADQWRVQGDHGETDDTTITHWERNDSDFAQIGTGMTESSGVFTFPATGIYKVDFYATTKRAANQNLNRISFYLQLSTDSGSNWGDRVVSASQMASAGDNQETFSCGSMIVDVTNASTFRVRLYIDAATHVRPQYASHANRTYMTFMKLGET